MTISLRALCFVFIFAAVGFAQKKKPNEKWKEDPYTKNDPVAMRAAGSVSYRPFPFGDNHGTKEMQHVLGEDVPLITVETAHFRIATSWGPYNASRAKRADKKRLKEALKGLKKKLPKIKPTTTKLDPWLRVHLLAHRLEDLYAEPMGQKVNP